MTDPYGMNEDIIDEEVYADFICNNCDTPGARKFLSVLAVLLPVEAYLTLFLATVHIWEC
ncbi:hypothetical protein EV421DRAFT_2044936 [Armillaria borealis]|uniref:Uncharacterized protein n=1 Tax=Armillaria borealis TaxID=47425 RepID=A0AA39M5P4_9AGAR|nr:hypothetical protein EV421DRAFT_2044936 [Armillaria borealis]